MSLERFLLVALDTSSQSLAALEMAVECATMGGYGLKGILGGIASFKPVRLRSP